MSEAGGSFFVRLYRWQECMYNGGKHEVRTYIFDKNINENGVLGGSVSKKLPVRKYERD